MVKFIYKKTVSFWSRIFTLVLSFFSFSSGVKAATSYRTCLQRDLSALQSSYKKLLEKSDNLKRKLEVVKGSSSGNTMTYDNLLNEIQELEVIRNQLLVSIDGFKSRLTSGDTNKMFASNASSSSSYNFCD